MSNPEDSGTPAFRDPRPTVERISQLAQRVLTGDILLPKFQRDFVWPRKKIIGLLDSIARNYPIGSILLWQSRQELASERTIAGLDIANQRPDYPVNYLLDGQQRLSTVCGSLYWQPGESDSIWNIVYDLQSRLFLHLYTLDEPPLTQVPLRYLSDAATFFRRVSAIADPGLEERANQLFNRFRDYMLAAVTLADMPINDIAPIFERINSTGTPLTIVDLMRAATWNPAFDLRDSISAVLTELQSRAFSDLDPKTILRSVAASAGFGFAVEDIDRLRTKSVEELRVTIEAVGEASRRAVDFLTSHIKAPRPQALPYANQFAVLTYIFDKVPVPSGEEFAEIERWFWRTTMSGYFGGWNSGQMAADFNAVDAFATGGQLEVSAALPRDEIWRVTQFRSNSAVSKMLALMLSYSEPVDLLTGQRIDARVSLAWNNDREYHHLFPRDYLKGKRISIGRSNSAANIVLLTSASNIRITNRAPSEYLGELIAQVGRHETLRRCATLLVSEQALDAALADDYQAYLLARAATLQELALSLVGGSADEPQSFATDVEGEAFVDDPAEPEAVGVADLG